MEHRGRRPEQTTSERLWLCPETVGLLVIHMRYVSVSIMISYRICVHGTRAQYTHT